MTIELAIHAPDAHRLEALVTSADSRRSEFSWLRDAPPYSRLYFGSEFCQHLLPSVDDTKRAADAAEERDWGLSLLTSYSTDPFVEQTMALVHSSLEHTSRKMEVIANDWGLIRRLRLEFGDRVTLVVGRGLNRMMRDPRVPDVGPEHLAGDQPPDTWHHSSMHSRGFRDLLTQLGVGGVESDLPLQGVAPLPESDIPSSIHAPWGMVASGRICLVNAWGKPGALRFVPPMHCDAPCRRFAIEIRAPWSRRQAGAESLPLVEDSSFIPLTRLLNRRRNVFPEAPSDPAPRFFQKGNTHFYRLEPPQIEALLNHDGMGFDRLVVAPDLPM